MQHLLSITDFSADELWKFLHKAKELDVFTICEHFGRIGGLKMADGPQSLLFPQAENRLHAQKGILALLLSK
jgi:ornithine carbamoyltransferase